MAITNSLIEQLSKTSILSISLHGVRTALENELNLKNILISTDEAIKGELIRENHATYPETFLILTELMAVKDQNSNRATQRNGFTAGLAGVKKGTTRKAYLFPMNVGLTLKYVDSQPERALRMAEALVILSQIGGITFEIALNSGGIKFLVRIEIPDTTSIPIASVTSAENPSGTEIEVQLVVHTFAGFFRDVSAVNSGNADLDFEIINHAGVKEFTAAQDRGNYGI